MSTRAAYGALPRTMPYPRSTYLEHNTMPLSVNQQAFLDGRMATVDSIYVEVKAAVAAGDAALASQKLNTIGRPLDLLQMGCGACLEEGGPDGEFAPTHPKAADGSPVTEGDNFRVLSTGPVELNVEPPTK